MNAGDSGAKRPSRSRRLLYFRKGVFPLERVLLWHWAVQLLRILFVAWLFSSLWALGRLVDRLLELTSEEAPDRRLIEVALGFGVYSAIVRSLGAIGLASREVVLSILLVSTLSLLFPRRKGPLRIPRLERPSWKTGVLAGLALIPLPMALAPAVSYDALVYHLRFPEMTLWSGFWTIDPFNSPSAFPAATETVARSTPIVSASNSCVIGNTLVPASSADVSIQRAQRAFTTWKRVHAAVCEVMRIVETAARFTMRPTRALPDIETLSASMSICSASPSTCTTARQGDSHSSEITPSSPSMPLRPMIPASQWMTLSRWRTIRRRKPCF